MKIPLPFLIVMLFSVSCFSQAKDKQEFTYLRVKSGDEVTTYEFHSIQDFEQNSEKILDEMGAGTPSDKKERATKITIEVSITVTSDNESVTITGAVTAARAAINIEVKKLRTRLIAIAVG